MPSVKVGSLHGHVAAIVLAAGAGTRFGATEGATGPKLLAPLGRLPVLQHVLDMAAGLELGAIVVVLGYDADAIEGAISWRNECRVRNMAPQRGLSSSVQVGLAAVGREAVARDGPTIGAALILLGDQPDVSATVIGRLLAAAEAAPERPIVVPLYEDGGATNPVLLRRSAWPLAEELSGDRGFGPLIASRSELVEWVRVEGAIHDVDTPADLRALRKSV